MMKHLSLEDVEKNIFSPKPNIFQIPSVKIELLPSKKIDAVSSPVLSLDGIWDMVEGGDTDRIYERQWGGAVQTRVPGSIHKGLMDAGIIPDPSYGKNYAFAREKSFKVWWLRKNFICPKGYETAKIFFWGICESGAVWLNGRLLGECAGMFVMPNYDVSGILVEGENSLVVKINPAPYKVREPGGPLNDFFTGLNIGWTEASVFNCVYGWHYANVPSLGIWQSVVIKPVPAVEIVDPFITTVDVKKGLLKLATYLLGPEGGYSGKLHIDIEPENFEGDSFECIVDIESQKIKKELCFEFSVPDCKLWWPNGIGKQNLYKAALRFCANGNTCDSKKFIFGIRSIEMLPSNDCANESEYNWLFCINGENIFVKGVNWCTIDYLMDFSSNKYDRFLTLAKLQHVQLLRAWGGGMPETDEFYDLCDRKGLMVMQEWPTAWDSQKMQPPSILRETVIQNTIRIRNHPSLAIWTGGNEADNPTDAVMDMIGRLTYEYDGTRVFHRNDPWGGSRHNYTVYWEKQDFDFNLSLKSTFLGEFGFASSPNYESVKKYIPEPEQKEWPPWKDGAVEYHTPVFNTKNDMKILERYNKIFLPDVSLENFVLASQMSQAVALRHTLELARSSWPGSRGACYYKMTDVFPSVSWSTVDYYGAAKMSYYAVQDSYAPLHACVLLKTLKPEGKEQILPVYLLDDANQLDCKAWEVKVRVYNSNLKKTYEKVFSGNDSIDKVRQLGAIELSEQITKSIPLFIVSEIIIDSSIADRTFYWLNFEASQGCLFKLPQCEIKYEILGNGLMIRNISDIPAVSVNVLCGECSDSIVLEDNFFWLDAGEERFIEVSDTNIDNVSSWNSK